MVTCAPSDTKRQTSPHKLKAATLCAVSADFVQALFEAAGRWCGGCARLAGHPCADAVCAFIDLPQRRAPEIAVHQSGGESVDRPPGVAHRHSEAGMFAALVGRNQETAPGAARDAN